MVPAREVNPLERDRLLRGLPRPAADVEDERLGGLVVKAAVRRALDNALRSAGNGRPRGLRPFNPRWRPRISDLEPRTRLLIIARARQLVEDAGVISPAYTLEELGKLGPWRLGLWQVRRVILAEPDGRELLAARLEAWRSSARARCRVRAAIAGARKGRGRRTIGGRYSPRPSKCWGF